MSSSRPVVRTEDWIEPSHDSRPGTAQASSATVDAAAAHLSNLSIGSGPEEGSGKSALLQEASEKKEKVKTRGVADPSRAEEEAAGQQADEDEAATPERSTFKVNSRAMGVVAMLFHQPSAHDQPGDLDWKDFAYTMTAIGFAATQAYGSAWNFAPTGDQLMALSRNSIQIHQPHPAPKFSFVQARRLGRRLTRKYGLDASCFEEKEGNDEEGGEKEPEE